MYWQALCLQFPINKYPLANNKREASHEMQFAARLNAADVWKREYRTGKYTI